MKCSMVGSKRMERPQKAIITTPSFAPKRVELGLLVDEKGVTQYAERSPFKDVLSTFGIETSEEESPINASSVRGKSKLKKWTCGCTNVRVAVADFRALCLKCGNEFTRDGDHSKPSNARGRGEDAGGQSDNGGAIDQWETDGGAVRADD